MLNHVSDWVSTRDQPTVDGSASSKSPRTRRELLVRMAPLIRFDAVSVAFGEQRILFEANFSIESGERVCLIGRNGAGKSTTLKLITGTQEPDDGTVERPGRLRWSLLDQNLAEESAMRVRDFVALGMAQQLERIARSRPGVAGRWTCASVR
jgi:ATPase subunit of ABC transporter with duplicated ATPase domains